MTLLDPQPRLYSPGQIAVASLLGSPFAGSILLGLNERALGRTSRALWIVGGGFFGSAAMIAAGFFLPPAASEGLGIGSIVAMHRLSVMTRDTRSGHEAERSGSWPFAVALGVITFAMIVGAAILVFLLVG